jgi:hypothetical protein
LYFFNCPFVFNILLHLYSNIQIPLY